MRFMLQWLIGFVLFLCLLVTGLVAAYALWVVVDVIASRFG